MEKRPYELRREYGFNSESVLNLNTRSLNVGHDKHWKKLIKFQPLPTYDMIWQGRRLGGFTALTLLSYKINTTFVPHGIMSLWYHGHRRMLFWYS